MGVGGTRYRIRPARCDELAGVLAVQHRAFGRVAKEAGLDPEQLDPVRETHKDLRRLFDSGTLFLVAVTDEGVIVGSVRGWFSDGILMVNRLVIEDGWERLGIATALMDSLEGRFSEAEAFRLFTGATSHAPLALYTSRGYRVVGTEDKGQFQLAWLEKRGADTL